MCAMKRAQERAVEESNIRAAQTKLGSGGKQSANSASQHSMFSMMSTKASTASSLSTVSSGGDRTSKSSLSCEEEQNILQSVFGDNMVDSPYDGVAPLLDLLEDAYHYFVVYEEITGRDLHGFFVCNKLLDCDAATTMRCAKTLAASL